MGTRSHKKSESKTKHNRKKAKKRLRMQILADLNNYKLGIIPLGEITSADGGDIDLNPDAFIGYDTVALDLTDDFDQGLLNMAADIFGKIFEANATPSLIYVTHPDEPGKKILSIEVADSNFDTGTKHLPIIFGAEICDDVKSKSDEFYSQLIRVYIKPIVVFCANIVPNQDNIILWSAKDQKKLFS